MHTRRHRTRFLLVFLCAAFLIGSLPMVAFAGDADANYSRTSTSEEDTADSYDAVSELANVLCQWSSGAGDLIRGEFVWAKESDPKRGWTYYNGVMMDAFLMLFYDNENGEYDGDAFNLVNNFYDNNITNQGTINGRYYASNTYRSGELESIAPSRALFDLLRYQGLESQYVDKFKKSIAMIYGNTEHNTVAQNSGGNFMYNRSSKWRTYQVALDGVYMSEPFFMELANAIDDGILTFDDIAEYTGAAPYTASQDEIYTNVFNRMSWIGNNLYVQDKLLFCHGWGPESGPNFNYWLRSVGWYAAALADVISMFPEGHANERNSLIEIEKRLFDGMMTYQDKETGMWYNVINHGPELQGSAVNNELETSGTALIAYAMMKSYVDGYLDDTYGEAGLRAFNGTVMNYLVDGELRNTYNGPTVVEVMPEGYLTNPYVENDAKGLGPLMMAASYAKTAAAYHAHPTVQLVGADDRYVETGEQPDFSGVSAILTYGNGTSITATSDDLTFGDCDSSVAGTQSVEVYYKDVLCGTISVTFSEPASPNPSFASESLALGSSIGVNFFVRLPGDVSTYVGSYMAFFVNGLETDVPFALDLVDARGFCKFTCPINVLQMAEEITAVYHYGEGGAETIDYTGSVIDYLYDFQNNPSKYESEVVDLANAVFDYGCYCQSYLTRVNGLEDKYEPMPSPVTQEYNLEDLAAATDKYKFSATGASAIDKAHCSLRLDSNTTLYIYFTPKTGFAGTPVVSVDGKQVGVVKRDGRYVIAIENIPAHELGNFHEVSITTDEECVLTVSPLSYVNAVLAGNTELDAKQAMASCYKYFEKTIAYRDRFGINS